MPAIGNPEDGRVGTCGGGFYGDTLVVLGAVPAGENLDLMASLDQRLLQAADVLLALVVTAPIVAAALTPVLGRRLGRNVAAFNGLVLLALVVVLLRELPGVLDGEVVTFSQAWIPNGPSLDLRLDALALVFALVVTLIGVLVMAYALRYFAHDDPDAVRIPALLALFACAMAISSTASTHARGGTEGSLNSSITVTHQVDCPSVHDEGCAEVASTS